MSACGVSRRHRRSRRLAYALARRVSPNAGTETLAMLYGREAFIVLASPLTGVARWNVLPPGEELDASLVVGHHRRQSRLRLHHL